MRTQNRKEQLAWIIWLITLILLNAIALAGGAGRKGGEGRAPSGSTPKSSSARQSSPPAVSPNRSAPMHSSSSASQSAFRSQRREAAAPVTQSTPSRAEVRSYSQPTRSSRSSFSSSPTMTVSRSRPVEHEVIVAPRSQSLDISPSRTVSKAAPSITASRESTFRESTRQTISPSAIGELAKKTPTVLVASVERGTTNKPAGWQKTGEIRNQQADRSGNTVSTPKQSRQAESSQVTTAKKDWQPKSNSQTIVSSSAARDTSKSKESASSRTPTKIDNAPVSNRSDRFKNTVVRYEGTRSGDRKSQQENSSITDKKTQSTGPGAITSGNLDRKRDWQSGNERSNERTETAPVVTDRPSRAERSGGTPRSETPQDRPESRWSKLRSEIRDRADRDPMPTRNERPGEGDRRPRDENRGRVMVDNDHIRVEGGDRMDHRRPHVPRHLVRDVGYIRNDHRWRHHGSCFSFHWSNWSCGRIILAPYYDWYGISYYYPYYHRKYLFVSLGGYWPYSYRYRRYYWYGCHPYYWYGAYVDTEPTTVVYDYTTTNYYYNTTSPVVTTEPAVAASPVEETSVTDAPLPQTQADIYFANAVNAFEAGNYNGAAELFREAVLMSPDDEVLPFTYSQALFAAGDYALSAYVLREIMTKIPAEEPAVYFPRGLYKDDQILNDQIARLENEIRLEPFCTDYQLLLGYQYLGIGQWDKAVNALGQAARSPLNVDIVNKLLDIAEKMENEAPNTSVVPQS